MDNTPKANSHKVSSSIPQCVGGDRHNAFRALLRGKARGILQSFIREGGEVEAGLVRVAEPRTAGHCQHLSIRANHVLEVQQTGIQLLIYLNLTVLYVVYVYLFIINKVDIRLPAPASWLWTVWQVVTPDIVFWYQTSHRSQGPRRSSAARRSGGGD